MKTSSLVQHLLALSGRLARPSKALLPAIIPFNRRPTDIEPADSYERGAMVWVHVGGGWRCGRVVECGEGVVLVCYYTPGSGDIAVEAVMPSHLLRRKP